MGAGWQGGHKDLGKGEATGGVERTSEEMSEQTLPK